MALLKRLNPTLKANNDTGFGINASGYNGRLLNKDGSFNVKKEGADIIERMSLYNSMLTMPLWKFLAIILVFFIVINVLFSFVYLGLGKNEISGIDNTTPFKTFEELFFFSAQTFTTVGYGRINPVGVSTSFIASFEALLGFVCFAIVTGLIYGRFSYPKAYLQFSENALIAPYQNKTALMFRFVNYKDNHTLTDVEVRVTLRFVINEHGNTTFKFFQLPLERSKVDSLVMNWTVVHPINEESPIYGFSLREIQDARTEIFVLVRGYDDIFSNTVQQRTSYTYNEFIFDAKFDNMYSESRDGQQNILQLKKLNNFTLVNNSALQG